VTELDPLAIAGRVAAAFERLGVRYLLGGSLASTAMGEPRATLDVDMVADLGPETVVLWIALLGAEFAVDTAWARDEVARRGSFQVMHLPSLLRIDVFVPPWEGIHLWKWQRRRRLDVGEGIHLDVTAPEGIVVQKLVWFRSGGEVSDRQWRDVLGVLKAQGLLLERSELRVWAMAVGVSDLLERALRQAGVLEP
jgi:hypothetical protein